MSKLCKKCGKELNPESKFCDNCGEPIAPETNQLGEMGEEREPAPKKVNKKLEGWQIGLIVGGILIVAAIIVFVVATNSCGTKKVTPTTASEEISIEIPETEKETTAPTTKASENSFLLASLYGKQVTQDGKKVPSVIAVEISDDKFITKGYFNVAKNEDDLWKGQNIETAEGTFTYTITNATKYYSRGGDGGPQEISQADFLSTAQQYSGLGLFIVINEDGVLVSASLCS